MINEDQLAVGVHVRWQTRCGIQTGTIVEIVPPYGQTSRALPITRLRPTPIYVVQVVDQKQSRARVPRLASLLAGEIVEAP